MSADSSFSLNRRRGEDAEVNIVEGLRQRAGDEGYKHSHSRASL